MSDILQLVKKDPVNSEAEYIVGDISVVVKTLDDSLLTNADTIYALVLAQQLAIEGMKE
jgi:hypothetical protein